MSNSIKNYIIIGVEPTGPKEPRVLDELSFKVIDAIITIEKQSKEKRDDPVHFGTINGKGVFKRGHTSYPKGCHCGAAISTTFYKFPTGDYMSFGAIHYITRHRSSITEAEIRRLTRFLDALYR